MQQQDFDSKEEWEFYNWLLEAEKAGIVSNIIYHPNPFVLSEKVTTKAYKKMKTKVKMVETHLFHPHKYTPDFKFFINDSRLFDCLKSAQFLGLGYVYVDVKGKFQPYGGDDKQFSINQKWVYQRFGIYVEKVVPEKLFKKSWVPEIARYTPKQRKEVKKYIGCMTIDEFVKEKDEIVF